VPHPPEGKRGAPKNGEMKLLKRLIKKLRKPELEPVDCELIATCPGGSLYFELETKRYFVK
jgi:hypothetical protein